MALSAAQLEARRSIIGGSDAITIMWGDTDDWRALYNEKKNGIAKTFPQKNLDLMEMGQAMEPLTLKWFAREHHALRKLAPELVIVWKVDPFFAFTPDGITADTNLPVQAKFHAGDKSIMDLADFYGVQLLHEMLCMGVRKCYLAVTFGHYGRRQHLEVEQDDAAVDAYLQRAMAFKEYLSTGNEPDWMAAPVGVNIPRKRDHVWDVGDNLIGALCTTVMETYQAKARFEPALEELKKMCPDDAATATWRNAEGYGITLKVARNNSKRWFPVGPKGVISAEETTEAVTIKINPRAKRTAAPVA